MKVPDSMATAIELKPGEDPRKDERYAMVFVSAKQPTEGAAIEVRDYGQTFFADDEAHDVSVILERAMIWAEQNAIPHVYIRRDSE